MAALVWNDSFGPATLTNKYAGTPASRFAFQGPRPGMVGERVAALGDGMVHAYAHGFRYEAVLRLEYIPNTSQALAERLIVHLLNAGTVEVQTDDSDGRVYTLCQLVEGETPELEMTDRAAREWALTLRLRNVAVGATSFVLTY